MPHFLNLLHYFCQPLCRSEPLPLPRNKSEQFIVSMQIYLLTSPPKFHTGLHLLSLICWGCLPCPARLWQPRFCAGRGTYSPCRRPAPHPVILLEISVWVNEEQCRKVSCPKMRKKLLSSPFPHLINHIYSKSLALSLNTPFYR